MDKKILKTGGIILGVSFVLNIIFLIVPYAFILVPFVSIAFLVGIIMVIVGLVKSPPTAKVVAQKADIYEDEKEKKSSVKKATKTSRKKEQIFCKNCGKQIPVSSKFCEHCGEKV